MKKLLLKSILLLCALVVGTSAWADTEILSWSRSTTTDTYTDGYTFSTAASAQTGYYQDGSGTVRYLSLYHTTNKLLNTTPSKVTFTAKLGGGTTKNPLSNNVLACFVDKNGNDIAGSEVTVTTKITNTTGSNFSVDMSTAKVTDAYGVKIYHTKESGYNVRYYSFSLSYTAAATKVATPTFSPAAGAVASGTEVTISCATDGATIYYTTDGTEPSSSSTPYNPSSKPTITAATTIKAIGIKGSLTNSDVATASYTIAEPCETPTFSPAAGEVDKGASVSISCGTDGATIYYTTDGTDPTTSSTVYSSTITINSAMTIKAIAAKAGNANSAVASATYTVRDYATLPFNWAGGTPTEILALSGVTGNSLGDYAAGHAPYRIQFNSTSDYIQVKTNAQPGKVYVDVKMIGGATTSKIKIQESADGSAFTDVEEFTISGSQDDIHNFATTKMFKATSRYVRIIKSLHATGGNIGVGPIKITGCTTASVTAYQWSTYVSDKALDFTDSDIKAYVVTGASGSAITKTQVYEVAANTPLLLNAPAATYAIPVATSGTDYSSSNKLVAGDGTAVAYDDNSGYNYVLSVDGSNAMFMRIVDGKPATVSVGKAYLALDSAPSAHSLNLFDDEETTGVNEVKTQKADGQYFNLAGQRVAQPTKGLYIVNGKKVMVK